MIRLNIAICVDLCGMVCAGFSRDFRRKRQKSVGFCHLVKKSHINLIAIYMRSLAENLFFYFKIYSFIIVAIFAGYSVQDVNPEILELTTRWYSVFIICFILAMSFFDFRITKWRESLLEVIIFAIISTITIEAIKKYNKKENENN